MVHPQPVAEDRQSQTSMVIATNRPLVRPVTRSILTYMANFDLTRLSIKGQRTGKNCHELGLKSDGTEVIVYLASTDTHFNNPQSFTKFQIFRQA